VHESEVTIVEGSYKINLNYVYKERQQKKKYYKEELAKLQKECELWKNEAQVHKAKVDEMTDKNFDLESQLKKQKLKNKELLLGIARTE
jgi:hypothetical protein